MNHQLYFWEDLNEVKGNKLDAIILILKKLQNRVCQRISDMTATWKQIADSKAFNATFENELTSERNNFMELEKEIFQTLEPFETAREFYDWTNSQMKTLTNNSIPEYSESGYDDIILEEYLSGTVIIMNIDLWIHQAASINTDIEKIRIFAFKDFCMTEKLPYRRIFLKTTIDCPKSLTNKDPVDFRKKIIRSAEMSDVRKKFLSIKNELKPISPLFVNFKSYQFIVSYINDAFIQTCLDSYFRNFADLDVVNHRLEAIGKVRLIKCYDIILSYKFNFAVKQNFRMPNSTRFTGKFAAYKNEEITQKIWHADTFC